MELHRLLALLTYVSLFSVSIQQNNKFFARVDSERWVEFFDTSMKRLNKWRKDNGIATLKFNEKLMTIAQEEAERLATQGGLDVPKFEASDLTIYGQSSQFNGYIKTTEEQLGFKKCYDTKGDKVYDEYYNLMARCLPYDVVFTEYGFGRAYDTNQVLYTVDLFLYPNGSPKKNSLSKNPNSKIEKIKEERQLLLQLLDLLDKKLS